MARTSTHKNKAAATADDRSTTNTPRTRPAVSDIARRAYDLFEARGREDGHDLDDWLQAERELQGAD